MMAQPAMGQPMMGQPMGQPMMGQPMMGQPMMGQPMMVQPPQPGQQQQIGLQLLAGANNLVINQKVELLEVFTGFETPNKYKVKNELGQDLFYAAEKSECCARMCLGNSRPFEMKMMTPDGSQIMNIIRPFRFYANPCCCCYLQKIDVFDHMNQYIGSVQQLYSLFRRYLHVYNAQHQPIFELMGPVCSPWTFRIRVPGSEQEIGQIHKQWSGLAKELFTDADNFGIIFPPGVDLSSKQLLTASVFFIDFLYFERANGQQGAFIGNVI